MKHVAKPSSQRSTKRILIMKRDTVEHLQASTFNQTIRDIAAKGETAILDFTEIRSINSSSLHYLQRVLNSLRPKLEISGIPVLFVEMLNTTIDFFPKEVVITSFFAPFYDPETNEQQPILLRVGEDVTVQKTYLDFDASCVVPKHSNLLPDFQPDEYFSFLKSQSPAPSRP